MLLTVFVIFPAMAEPVRQNETLEGYNINWSFLPQLNPGLVQNAVALHPEIIRYPGGTVSKTWQWRLGSTTRRYTDTPHPLRDLRKMVSATGAQVTFVLNLIHATLEDQLAMLDEVQKMGIPIRYIEMGNEYYLGKGKNIDDSGEHWENVQAFPSGKDYALAVNRWVPKIRSKFPEAKIGISLLGRSVRHNSRQKEWNRSVIKAIRPDAFDACIYHVYVHLDHHKTWEPDSLFRYIHNRVMDLKRNMVDLPDKEVWITEYGVHAASARQTASATQLLADQLEPLADILLPHILFSRSQREHFSLLTPPEGEKFTPLGTMFLQRAEKRHRDR